MLADFVVRLALLLFCGGLMAIVGMVWLYFRDLADLKDSYKQGYPPLAEFSRFAQSANSKSESH